MSDVEELKSKLDKVADILGNQLAGPMACTLKEIKRSNRARWVVLVVVTCMVIGSVASTCYAVSKMEDISRQLRKMQFRYVVQTARVTKLIDLAEKNASSPEMRDKLQKLQKMKEPVPEDVVKAAADLAPEVVLKQAKKLEKDSVSED